MNGPIYAVSGLLLTASPLDIVLDSKAPVYLNIANNILAGTTAGFPVSVMANGVAPGWTVDYGTQRTIVLNAPRWVRIQGDGANVTLNLSEVDSPISVSIVGANPGTRTTNLSLPITGVAAAITCPAGSRLRIPRLNFTAQTASTLSVAVHSGTGGGQTVETITPGDQALGAGAVWAFGQGWGNQEQIQGAIELYEGDSLWVSTGTGTIYLTGTYLQEPL